MVSEPRYLSHHDGAPPTPPPGGYQHERRFPASPFEPAAAAFPAQKKKPNPRLRHPLGWVALSAAAVFGVVLLATLLVAGPGAVYGTTMLALQLIVAAAVITALVVAPARAIGSCALALALILNIGTVGAAGAVQASASGTYAGAGAETDPEAAYPGVKGVDDDLVLEAPSLEETADGIDRVAKKIRDELSAEFGFTWVSGGEPALRGERNGYGGESMLQEYTAPGWATNEPIHGYDEKMAVMRAIDRILYDEGVYYSLYPLNDPAQGSISAESMEQLYGSTDPREQVRWSYYTELTRPDYSPEAPSPPLFYADIIDLDNDDTGRWTQQQEALAEDYGQPVEGLTLQFIAPQQLSEKDREAFVKALEEHPEPTE